MCRVIEEVREEGRIEGQEEGRIAGREEARSQMIAILLMSNSEEDILYNERFTGLHVTQEEIDAAKERLKE